MVFIMTILRVSDCKLGEEVYFVKCLLVSDGIHHANRLKTESSFVLLQPLIKKHTRNGQME